MVQGLPCHKAIINVGFRMLLVVAKILQGKTQLCQIRSTQKVLLIWHSPHYLHYAE